MEVGWSVEWDVGWSADGGWMFSRLRLDGQ